jgi:hypothetical protein
MDYKTEKRLANIYFIFTALLMFTVWYYGFTGVINDRVSASLILVLLYLQQAGIIAIIGR